jgi:hypothetical protein
MVFPQAPSQGQKGQAEGADWMGKIASFFEETDTSLDQVKTAVQKDLDKLKRSRDLKNLAANLYATAEAGFKKDLNEIGVRGKEAQEEFIVAFHIEWAKMNMAPKSREILESPELAAIDGFISKIENLPKLKEIINSAKPMPKWEAWIKSQAEIIPSLGKFVNENFELILNKLGFGLLLQMRGETTEEPTKTGKAEDAAKANTGEKKGQEDAGEEAKPAGETDITPEATAKQEATKPKTEVSSVRPVSYEPIPRLSEKALTGSEFMKEYEKLESAQDRYMFVLQQLAIGNVPEHFKKFETIRVTGRNGTVVEMQVARHGLRIGTDSDYVELPLDGPTAMAAAEMYGCTLATPWISDQIHEQAKASGGVVKFFTAPEIAEAMEIKDWDPNHPDGKMMKSAAFTKKRNELLKKWRKEHGISDEQLTSGYFKDITHPIPGVTRQGRLEIYGGYRDDGSKIQKLSGGFHVSHYHDYSHLPRFVRPTIKVNGQVMSLSQFTNTTEYALEFGFQKMAIGQAYDYPPALASFVKKNKSNQDTSYA